MITFLYVLTTILLSILFAFLFNLITFTWWNLLFWPLVVLFSVAIASFLTVAFIFVFERTMKEIDPHNVRRYKIANSILRLGRRIMHVTFIVTGKENIPEAGQPFVFVCNHQENYDIICIKPVFKNHPLNFIAKASAMKWVIFGRWIKMLGNIPMPKEVDRRSAESMVQAIKYYKEGIPMGVFPEGRRSFGNDLLDFKPGALKLAMKPKADIVIGTIYDFCKIFKGWPFKKQKIYFHIHPIVKYQEYQHMNSMELAEYIRAIIQTKLDEYQTMTNK